MEKGSRRKKIRVIVPVTSDEWNVPVRDELERYRDANTEISVVNINEGPKAIECAYDETRAAMPVVREAERAEEDGYDGVILYCFADPGARAAKEKLNIPVVGLNEASVHIASLIGTKFGIISTGPVDYYLRDLVDLLRLYGFEDKCVSVRSITMPVLDLQAQKEQQDKRLLEEVTKAINDDGVDTIVLGCGGMLALSEELLQLGVPIVVPGVAALKLCEDLIDMKLSQSKRCFNIPAGAR